MCLAVTFPVPVEDSADLIRMPIKGSIIDYNMWKGSSRGACLPSDINTPCQLAPSKHGDVAAASEAEPQEVAVNDDRQSIRSDNNNGEDLKGDELVGLLLPLRKLYILHSQHLPPTVSHRPRQPLG